jgi:phage tail protein X
MGGGLGALLGFPLGDDDTSAQQVPSTLPSYTTRSGDTWDMIAVRVYGAARPLDAERFMAELLDANPAYNYIARFDAGVVLSVPPLPAPLPPASLPPWRKP